MYTGIRREKPGLQARSGMCEDKDCQLIAETNQVLERWSEHFEEVLNNPSDSGVSEQNKEYLGGPDPFVQAPTLSEVEEAIKKM